MVNGQRIVAKAPGSRESLFELHSPDDFSQGQPARKRRFANPPPVPGATRSAILSPLQQSHAPSGSEDQINHDTALNPTQPIHEPCRFERLHKPLPKPANSTPRSPVSLSLRLKLNPWSVPPSTHARSLPDRFTSPTHEPRAPGSSDGVL